MSHSQKGIRLHAENMSYPSQSALSDLVCDGLGICSSMELSVSGSIWPVNPQNPPEAAVLEDLQLLTYALGHLP